MFCFFWPYFVSPAKIFEGSDLDCFLSLNELIDLKTKLDPKIPSRGQKVKLTDFTQNIEYEFYSLSKAAAYILEMEGSCDAVTLRTNMKNNTIYKKKMKSRKVVINFHPINDKLYGVTRGL